MNEEQFSSATKNEKEENEKSSKSKKIIKILRDKYTIVTILFIALMLFSSESNIFNYGRLKRQKNDMERQKISLEKEIKKDSIGTIKVRNNADTAEKFAREKYLFKKDNEDIFIIRKNE